MHWGKTNDNIFAIKEPVAPSLVSKNKFKNLIKISFICHINEFFPLFYLLDFINQTIS